MYVRTIHCLSMTILEFDHRRLLCPSNLLPMYVAYVYHCTPSRLKGYVFMLALAEVEIVQLLQYAYTLCTCVCTTHIIFGRKLGMIKYLLSPCELIIRWRWKHFRCQSRHLSPFAFCEIILLRRWSTVVVDSDFDTWDWREFDAGPLSFLLMIGKFFEVKNI